MPRIPTVGGDERFEKEFADGSAVIYIPSVVDEKEHDELLNVQYPSLTFKPEKAFYGNPPCRDTTWHGPFDYTYSGKVELAAPTPSWMQVLRGKVERLTVEAIDRLKPEAKLASKVEFRGVLTNRYKDGTDSISLHADDESTLRKGAPIASFSLGAVRSLLMRHANTKSFASMRIRMNSGSLLIMVDCQQPGRWKHGVEKDESTTVRYNSTFREYAGQLQAG